MFKFLKKDSYWLGAILGIVVPGIIYIILHYLNLLTESRSTGLKVFQESTVQILSIVVNALMLRYYLVSLKFDKTGRGILLVTFIFTIAFFIWLN
jgi:hypothetical protein